MLLLLLLLFGYIIDIDMYTLYMCTYTIHTEIGIV